MSEGLSSELRRKGVAASTIREALGSWREQEMLRIIAKLAKGSATLESLLEVQSEAKAFHKLTKELEIAMSNGGIDQ
jgi:SOS response regulatory protein OraA/RecX